MTTDAPNNVILRRAASMEVSMLLESRKLIWEEYSHSFRWLMASLLGVNGATALAVANTQALAPNTKGIAIASCVIGIIAALFIAWWGQRTTRKMAEPLGNLIGYWMCVAEDGERFEEVETDFRDKMNAVMRFGARAQWAGWFSVLCFLVAVATVGVELTFR